MSEKERNEQEWKNPDNWRGGICGLYASERDTRLIVPKRNPKMGWTLNFAKPASYQLLAGLFLLAGLLTTLAILFDW